MGTPFKHQPARTFLVLSMSPLRVVVAILFLAPSVFGLAKYECTDTKGSTIPVEIPFPGHRTVITSPNYPDAFNNTGLDCKWSFKALHGAKVQVQLVDSDLNDGCFDNILTVVDDTPETVKESAFKYPGMSAACGQSSFGPVNKKHHAYGDTVTVTFKSAKNTGHATFKLLVTSIVLNKTLLCSAPQAGGCSKGPCCSGPDCCVVHPQNGPIDISIPNATRPGLDCNVKFEVQPGAQIALNFVEMDINANEDQACLTDYVRIEEYGKYTSSVIGNEGLTFCGQRLPNYPGPSVFVSGGNILTLKYHTDTSQTKKGTGFKAKVSVINPICKPMEFEYTYGDQTCNSTCGKEFKPPGPKVTTTTTEEPEVTMTPPTIPPVTPQTTTPESEIPTTTEFGVSTPKTSENETTTTTTTTEPPEKCVNCHMTITVLDEESGKPLTEARVTIKSKKLFKTQDVPTVDSTYITNGNGEIEEVGTIYGTYNFNITKRDGDGLYQTEVDKTITNGTCLDDQCKECAISIPILVSKKRNIPTPETPCTCQGKVTIVDRTTKMPVSGACVNYQQESEGVLRNSVVENLDASSRSLMISSRQFDIAEDCNKEWCKFEGTGSEFRYFKTPLSWKEARLNCKMYGAHLASIPSMKVTQSIESCKEECSNAGF